MQAEDRYLDDHWNVVADGLQKGGHIKARVARLDFTVRDCLLILCHHAGPHVDHAINNVAVCCINPLLYSSVLVIADASLASPRKLLEAHRA